MKEYMLMRGNITHITLILKKPRSKKEIKRKLKPTLFDKHDALAYWSEIVEIKNYKDELESLIWKRMSEYVRRKYKGKYELLGWEDLDFKERNLRMSSLPVKDCLEHMTAEQFVSQFGTFGGM